jgi:hypothetical protein
MAQPSKAKEPLRPLVTAWFDQPTEKVASALYSYAIALEARGAQRRIRNSVMYRLVTGEEPPVQFGLWLSRKSANSVTSLGSNYSRPYSNIMSNACSVLENRIGTTQAISQISPSNVSFDVRSACKQVTDFVDSVRDSNSYFSLSRLGFRDMFLFGMTFIKVSSTLQKQIKLERVFSDAILVDEISAAFAPPTDLLQVVFMRRSEAWAEFGGKDARTDAAIRLAPAAFSTNTAQSDDWIAAIEGWKLPGEEDGAFGRHTIALQNRVLLDDQKWSRKRFPFAVGRWLPPTMNYFVPGGAFTVAPYQMECNQLDEQIRACIRAAAYPVWLQQDGGGVSAQTMGMRPGAVFKWNGSKPDHVVPTAVNPELYQYRKSKENDGYASVGITGQQVQAQKQPGVTAGVALRLMVDYEDDRNKSLVIELENLGSAVDELILDEAEECRPEVVVTGVGQHTLKWDEISKTIKRDQYKVKPFPINALTGTPAEQQQKLSDWYANGQIDRRAFFRLQQLPDLASYANIATASDDLVEATLDDIVKTGKFIAPEPTYDTLQSALKVAQARFNLEKRYKSPRPVLRALRQFMSVLNDMIKFPDGQMLQPAPAPAAGLGPADVMPQAPAAGLPAPPPLQVAPAQAAPMQLAA